MRWTVALLAVTALTLLALFVLWLPVFGSPFNLASERVSSLMTSLGQVLIGYFAVVVAANVSVQDVAARRVDKWRYEAGKLTTEGEVILMNLLSKALEKLRGAYAAFDPKSILDGLSTSPARGRSYQRVEDLEKAYEACSAVSSALEKQRLVGRADEAKQECLVVLEAICNERLRTCYLEYIKLTEVQRTRLSTVFDVTTSFTFVHCVLCFWPDPLLSQTLWKGGSQNLPSGVVALGVTFVLSAMFIAGYNFVRRAAAIYDIGQAHG